MVFGNITIQKIIVAATPGATAAEAAVAGLALYVQHCCDVEFVHNGKHYEVTKALAGPFIDNVLDTRREGEG